MGVSIVVVALAGSCKFSGPEGARDGSIDPPDAPPDAPSTERKKVITIDPSKVGGDQTAFPVWIVLAGDNELKALALADGSDIHFTRTDGSPLEYEIQRWKKDTGRLEAWVRVELVNTAPTKLEIRYGDPSRKRAPNSKLVFASGFAAVWHLDDAVSMTNTTVVDSTMVRNGTAMNGFSSGDQVTAQLGGGIDFDGTGKQIQFANPYTGSGPHTISAWVNQRTPTGICDSIVTVGNGMDSQSRWFHSYHMQNMRAAVGFFNTTLDWYDATNMSLEAAGWVLVHWVFENGVSHLYRDGQHVDMHTHTGTVATQGAGGYLGFAPANWGMCELAGTLDEVRLATVARSAGWIATEYENQKSPQTFYSVGPEERSP